MKLIEFDNPQPNEAHCFFGRFYRASANRDLRGEFLSLESELLPGNVQVGFMVVDRDEMDRIIEVLVAARDKMWPKEQS